MITNAQDIHTSADIISIIGKYVELRRNGVNYTAACPFHDEKTASFTVSPTKGIYKCFGCGHGGDAVNFLKDHLHLTYPEALTKAAEMSSISVQYDDSVDRQEWIRKSKAAEAKQQDILATLAAAYELMTPVAPRWVSKYGSAMSHLYHGRLYPSALLQQYGIASPYDDHRLSTSQLNKEHLLEAGWIGRSKYGDGYYDVFRHRVLFPVTDARGRIVSISGRDITGKSKAKYINGKESDIFSKRDLLYGLHHAAKSIRDEGYCYLVEGQTDVLAMVQHGMANTVCPLGTALTAEQASILKKATDEVVLAYDGDALSKPSILRAIDILLAQQLSVSILLLPKQDDPDIMLRRGGLRAWQAMEEEAKQDAILWRVRQMNMADGHAKATAATSAARLVAMIESERKRNIYAKDLSKILGVSISDLKAEISECFQNLFSKKKQLTAPQEEMAQKYGVYISHHKYFKGYDADHSYEISNFSIDPIMLIITRDLSQRLVCITNEYEQKVILDINTDDFTTLGGLKKRLEARGNYLFMGKEEDFMKVKRAIYDKTPNCYRLFTMGHNKQGFWVWGNGLTLSDGSFKPVDKYGIVEHDQTSYYLSAFSQVNSTIMSDDDSNDDEPGEYHIYNPKQTIAFPEWSQQFYKVYGENAIIGMSYYIASIFRDVIFSQLSFFPHLNLFGPKGSGKSYMARNMVTLFGKPRPAVDLTVATLVAMSRRVAQIKNGLSWFEEYSNTIDVPKVALLKNIYDGIGRGKGRKTTDNTTSTTPVTSAALISGQTRPSQDPALMERCITLYFSPITTTKQQEADGKKLEEWGELGMLSHVTTQIYQMREEFEQRFYNKYSEMKDFLRTLQYDTRPVARVLNNFSIIAASAEIVREKYALPFTKVELCDFICQRINSQTSAVEGAGEVYQFWQVIEALIETQSDFKDFYAVEPVASVKITNRDDSQTTREFGESTRVLFLNFSVVYSLYKEKAGKMQLDRVPNKSDLLFYLEKTDDSYLGRTKAKNISGKTRRCHMFLADHLPIELDNTLFTRSDADELRPTKDDPFQGMDRTPTTGDIPFDDQF